MFDLTDLPEMPELQDRGLQVPKWSFDGWSFEDYMYHLSKDRYGPPLEGPSGHILKVEHGQKSSVFEEFRIRYGTRWSIERMVHRARIYFLHFGTQPTMLYMTPLNGISSYTRIHKMTPVIPKEPKRAPKAPTFSDHCHNHHT